MSGTRPPLEHPPSSEEREDPGGVLRFHRREIAAVVALILIHLVLVLWIALGAPPGASLLEWGGLRKGTTALQPWRLLGYQFLHADAPHVLWNGVSMLVFAVPVLSSLGYWRTGLVYLAAGVGGGLTAVTFGGWGPTIIGSSGAVSGLFGAWLVLTLHRARSADLPRRARIRAFGIALLVLPSLIQPTTAGGAPISVSSHLGGAATGMLVGALLSKSWLRSVEPAAPDASP